MKSLQLPFLAICLLASTFLTAQVTNNLQLPTSVNTDGAAPNASAILDVQSTTQGMLVPRMTTAQRTTIATPATGLLVYDTDTGGFWFYNGTAWADLSASKSLVDADGNTKIQVEESPDEDIIRMDLGGIERFVLRKNNAVGNNTMVELPNSNDNFFIGFNAGLNNETGSSNTFFGNATGQSNTTGSDNTFLGSFAGLNHTEGNSNVFIGRDAGGGHSMGTGNLFLGTSAGKENLMGSGNVFLGRSAGENETGSNKLYIDNSNTATPLIYGEFDNNLVGINGKLGIGTTMPSERLDVAGTVKATAFVGNGSALTGLHLSDTDNDTKIQVEESTDEDLIRFDLGGTEHFVMDGPRLEVKNSGRSVFIGEGAGANDDLSDNRNVAVGDSALYSNTTGSFNTANGIFALYSNTTGSFNTASGIFALYSNTTGFNNTANGRFALYSNTTGSNNTANGIYALYSNTTGHSNAANGRFALNSNTTGFDNTANGSFALNSNTTGSNNTANGSFALNSNTTGFNNTANGSFALNSNTTGSNNTANGRSALFSNTTGSDNTAIGAFAGVLSGDLSNATAIGHNAKVGCSNCLVLGGTGVDSVNVGIGITMPSERLDVAGTVKATAFVGNGAALTGLHLSDDDNDTKIQVEETPDEDKIHFGLGGTEHFVMDGPRLEVKNSGRSVFLGNGAGANDDLSDNQNVAVGDSALYSNTTGFNNTANGSAALYANTSGYDNTANGRSALTFNTTGSYNTANGSLALSFNTTGSSNTANGSSALYYNTTGSSNTANGSAALYSNTSGSSNTANGSLALYYNTTGINNTAIGRFALSSNTTGSYNTANGSSALASNTTGSSNTAIGSFADVGSGDLSKATAIGHNAKVDCSNCLVLGGTGTDAVKVGIGTAAPSSKLHLSSTDSVDLLIEADTDNVNEDDQPSLTMKQDGGQVTGQLGFFDSNNHFMLKNNFLTGELLFGTENTERMRIDNEGNVGIGTTDPLGKLSLTNNNVNTVDLLFRTDDGNPNNTNWSTARIRAGWETGEDAWSDAFLKFENPTASNTYQTTMTLKGGMVGIGITDPTHPLHMGSGARCTAAGIWTNASDRRLKTDIAPIGYGLGEVMALRPVSYRMKAGGEEQVGFIAQEVQGILPELISGTEGDIEKGETLGMSYGNLTAVLVKGMQEQQKIIEELKMENEILKMENALFGERLAKLEVALNSGTAQKD